MSNLLEFILYVFVGLWVLTLLFRWLFPYILNYFINYLEKSFFETQRSHVNNSYSSSSNPSSRKTFKSQKEKVGEYVDFEEID